MQFLDEAKIYLKAGDGGSGCVSFRREKFIEFGGPDGGNGGKGADIVFECADALNTLIDFRYQQHFKAQKGEHGKGDNRTGYSGEDLVLKVPVGTQIISEDGQHVIADMLEVGQRFTIVHGGLGGAGNAVFKSSVNQAPRRITLGKAGEELWVWLKLKLISDIGIIGLPNAGKSTFLARTTSAKPKIADYPFTTLKPQLGVVYHRNSEFVLADIPGLIEGASEGVGLGFKFLKHIERCKELLHLIDINSDDIIGDYETVLDETETYGIQDKQRIIALNKADCMPLELAREKQKILEDHAGQKVYLISAATGMNIDKILDQIVLTIKQPEELF